MNDEQIKKYRDEAKNYALRVVKGEELTSKYVRLECERFLDRLKKSNDGTFEYVFNYDKVDRINKILSQLIFPTGFKSGTPILEGLFGFQHFILHNIFCWEHKETGYRLIEKVTLQIARKNGKVLPSYMETYNRNRVNSKKL